jgi:hypothetical protein
MPPLASDACTYVVEWVAQKVRWGLAADPAEVQALRGLASGCLQAPIPAIPVALASP